MGAGRLNRLAKISRYKVNIPVDFKTLIEKLDHESYLRLKTAVEIGRFPNGQDLTEDQRQMSMQAVIAFEIQHEIPENQRTGFIPTKPNDCDSSESQDEEVPIKWK